MKRIDLFFKVEAEIGETETVEALSRDIVRTLEKMYGVRRAEVASIVAHGDD